MNTNISMDLPLCSDAMPKMFSMPMSFFLSLAINLLSQFQRVHGNTLPGTFETASTLIVAKVSLNSKEFVVRSALAALAAKLTELGG